MADADVTVSKLLESALESYGDHYKDLADTWRGLDTKAQGTAAISGVFIAASLAFVRELPATSCSADKVLLLLTLGCLAASVVLATLSMRIRTVEYPPSGPDVYRLVKDIKEAGGSEVDLPARVLALYSDQQRLWEKCVEDCRRELDSKARLLAWSQALLAASALLAVALTVVVLY